MEIHELYIKSNYAELKETDLQYKKAMETEKQFTAKVTADEKIRTSEMQAQNKLRLQDNALANKLIYDDYKQTQAKIKGLQGQSVNLPASGSLLQLSNERKSILTSLSSGFTSGGT